MESNAAAKIGTFAEVERFGNPPGPRNRYGHMGSLPLSWSRVGSLTPQFLLLKLPLSHSFWLPFANIPGDDPFETVFDNIVKKLPDNLVIRGCNTAIAAFLHRQGWGAIQVGAEAVLNLPGNRCKKASLRELVRRGLRHGVVCEVEYSAECVQKLEVLRRDSVHGRKPRLQYLFRSGMDDTRRCFVFKTTQGKWLGAVTLSRNGFETYHAELILRHSLAPIGVMEALLLTVTNRLREENCSALSLGEVPFMRMEPSRSGRTALLHHIGRAYKFAYNYEGLYRFKNKFEPEWRPLYICARPKITTTILSDLFFRSGCFRLAKYKIRQNVRTYRAFLATSLAQIFLP